MTGRCDRPARDFRQVPLPARRRSMGVPSAGRYADAGSAAQARAWETQMRILVAVASKHGSTAEIATAIAGILAEAGHTVVEQRPEDADDPSAFGAVVLGSGVYAGHWMREAKEYATAHASALRGRPVWLFSSGPLGEPPVPAGDPVDVGELMALLEPRGHEVFPGAMDRSDLGFGERAIVGMVKAPYGDFRDWPAITVWAQQIATELAALPAPEPVAIA
jgi:menaquinone-dependent protoporphyrinogen oxidase